MPLDGADDVQQLREQVWRRIEQLKANLSALDSSDGPLQLAALQQQVNELRRIIAEQEHLLHFSLESGEASTLAAQASADMWPSPVLRTANTPKPRSAEKRAGSAARMRRPGEENHLRV